MEIKKKEIHAENLDYIIRSAQEEDAKSLSEIRLKIDGETENLDREKGEAFLSVFDFQEIIKDDTKNLGNLFLVAVVNDKIVGFSRCVGSSLKRFSHKAEFGICILKDYWGFGIGKNLLKETVLWADSGKIEKISMNVLEKNVKAIELYKKFGFEVEELLKKDKKLSDGEYCNTVIMGRVRED